MKSRMREKHKTLKQGTSNQPLIPFENEIPCEGIVRFNFRNRTTAAYLLRRGSGELESFQFVFGFRCKGVHTTLKEGQIEEVFNAISDGLKDLPPGERLKIYFASFSSDVERQHQLTQICQQTGTPIQYLLIAEKQRIKELTQVGVRKPKALTLFCSYTVSGAAQTSDWMERILAMAERYWNRFTGVAPALQEIQYEEMLERAFTDGFLNWEQLLKVKMRLQVQPLEGEDLWNFLYKRFNSEIPPPLGQWMDFAETGLHENSDTDIHLTSLLFPTHQSIPIADRSHVYVKGDYVAPIVFNDKPAGWSSLQKQLAYFWEVFAREAVYDTEFVCELTRANELLVKENISRVARQANSAQVFSAKHKTIDVGASLRQRKAIAAQEALLEGEVPINVAVVLLVHRQTLAALDSACRYLQNCFVRPAWVDWEREYAWKVWLQCLPTCWERLLQNPFNRRLTYQNGEVPGFMSLVQPSPLDREGIELITDEGGTPIHLDLFSQHRNLGLFATTRAGKSVLVASILTHALARELPVIVMDFPPNEESSTFRDFTRYVGGSYFDLGTESNNLLELPDFSRFSAQERQERMVDFLEFITAALLIMTFGSGEPSNSSDRLLRQSIRSVLGPALTHFYEQPAILDRFERARVSGLGSEAWEQTPTLADFQEYLETTGLENFPVEVKKDPVTKTAIHQIKRQLRYWIKSRVGQSIARPSTFLTDAQLLVFALRGLGESDDAALLALAAYSAALRRTLSHPESIFFIDEFSVLLEWGGIAHLVSRLTANGAKAGIRVILAAQDPNTLANDRTAGPKIIQNLSTLLIGQIKPNAQSSFVECLGLEPQMIARNTGETFYPDKAELYSQWLLEERNTTTFVRFYCPPLLLAVVANNPFESRTRKSYIDTYGLYPGLLRFTQALVAALRDNRPIQLPQGGDRISESAALEQNLILTSRN